MSLEPSVQAELPPDGERAVDNYLNALAGMPDLTLSLGKGDAWESYQDDARRRFLRSGQRLHFTSLGL